MTTDLIEDDDSDEHTEMVVEVFDTDKAYE